MSLAVGARLGPYEIVAPLGAGGMGEVDRARDTRLGRELATEVRAAVFDEKEGGAATTESNAVSVATRPSHRRGRR